MINTAISEGCKRAWAERRARGGRLLTADEKRERNRVRAAKMRAAPGGDEKELARQRRYRDRKRAGEVNDAISAGCKRAWSERKERGGNYLTAEEQRQKRREYLRLYKQRPEVRERERESRRVRSRAWYLKNREKVLAREHARRAQRKL